MGRHPGGAERKLIAAAREMVPRTGLAGLRVRAVAARAGVNPGLFHYHFPSREAFCRRVLEEVYTGFFGELQAAMAGQRGRSCRERLARMLVAVARFERDHRAFSLSVVRDVLNGEGEALGFLRRNFPAHMRLLHGLVRECQRAGVIRRMPVPAVLAILAGVVSGPALSVGLMERALSGRPEGRLAAALAKVVLSDHALVERVELALRGLAPERTGRRPGAAA